MYSSKLPSVQTINPGSTSNVPVKWHKYHRNNINADQAPHKNTDSMCDSGVCSFGFSLEPQIVCVVLIVTLWDL